MFDRLLTKKGLLSISLIGVLFFVIAFFPDKIALCSNRDFLCFAKFEAMIAALFIFLPATLFSFITYKMHDEVFRAWRNFALWWLPLTVFCVLLASGDGSQSLPMTSTRGIVDIGMTVVFIITSTVIIVRRRNSQKGVSR